jgi:hypothetical protein
MGRKNNIERGKSEIKEDKLKMAYIYYIIQRSTHLASNIKDDV